MDKRTAVAALLPLLLAAALIAPAGAGAQDAGEDPSILEVAGSAEISVPADRARVALAVETEAESAGEASRENAERATAVVEAVRALEIEGLQVETRGYRLQPEYRRPDRGEAREVVAYRAMNQVMVTIDDVEATGEVVDTGIGAGANRAGSIEFDLRDREPAREEALREAVRKARSEARIIAEAMEVELGPVRRVTSDPGQPRFRVAATRAPAQVAAEQAPTPVEPGEVEVSAAVQVTFALEP